MICRSLEGFRNNGIPFFTRVVERHGGESRRINYSSRVITDSWKKSLDFYDSSGLVEPKANESFYAIFRASDVEMVMLSSHTRVTEYKEQGTCESLNHDALGE